MADHTAPSEEPADAGAEETKPGEEDAMPMPDAFGMGNSGAFEDDPDADIPDRDLRPMPGPDPPKRTT
jgi:hypothetical protein